VTLQAVNPYASTNPQTNTATLSATGQEKVKHGFAPLLEGFDFVPFNDVDAIRGAIGPSTCAVMLEPIQGEGGVRCPAPDFLTQVRAICDETGLLLIFDEIQVGMGRTGTLFAHEQEGVTPDVMTLAKALGGGIPIGAMCTTRALAERGVSLSSAISPKPSSAPSVATRFPSTATATLPLPTANMVVPGSP